METIFSYRNKLLEDVFSGMKEIIDSHHKYENAKKIWLKWAKTKCTEELAKYKTLPVEWYEDITDGRIGCRGIREDGVPVRASITPPLDYSLPRAAAGAKRGGR